MPYRASPFLRRVLLADAAASAVAGLAMLLGAGLLEPLLGIAAALLRAVGLAFLAYAAVVAYLGMHVRVASPAVQAVVAVNALWAAASILVLLTGWIAPTPLGYAFVIGQALAAAVFGALEQMGLRRPT